MDHIDGAIVLRENNRWAETDWIIETALRRVGHTLPMNRRVVRGRACPPTGPPPTTRRSSCRPTCTSSVVVDLRKFPVKVQEQRRIIERVAAEACRYTALGVWTRACRWWWTWRG